MEHLRSLEDTPVVHAKSFTLHEWASRWFADKSSSLRPWTRRTYHHVLQAYILPELGKMPISKIEARHIQALYRKLSNRLKPVTVHRIHRVLKTCLLAAVKAGYLDKSPFLNVEPPEHKTPPKPVLSVNDAFRLLAWLREHRPTSYMAAFLAIHTGMRMGEIAGLQWRDIDLDTGVIQLERTRYRPKGGQDFLGPPKTFGSRRRIVVTREVVDELRRWKQSQQEIERESWTPESFVVRLPNSAPPSPASFNNAIQNARKELGLPPVSFHGLRHTHATWLLESGVDLKIVSERLGHSSITITADIYAHVTDALQREAIEKLQRMMRSRRTNNSGSDDEEDL
ncbi:tyrosine-type recombinase/integrase [Alicyclobacillus acidocaldarius]|nr:site-specific integrase [Alicyclobacillus acidocaldarius]